MDELPEKPITDIRIVCVTSSCRKNGNTERFTAYLEEKLKRIGPEYHMNIRFDYVPLGRMDIRTCRGCRICFDKGEAFCPLKDDVPGIARQIADADGILLASPVYVEDVNGVMKNWIDRMAYLCHRPAFAGKTACILATSGSGASSRTLKTMSTALNSWGIRVVCRAKFCAGARISDEDILCRYEKQLERLALRFMKAIRYKAAKPSFYSLMAFKIQQNYRRRKPASGDSADYVYWKENGWLNPHVKYYKTQNCNPIKIAVARIIGDTVTKLLHY